MPIVQVNQEIAGPPSIVTTRRLDSLQAARAIGALLVVLCHTSAFIGEEPGLWHRTSIYLWFRGTALGVQLFFVLSGIVIFSAHRKDFDQPNRTPLYFWKRFRRIYPIYWIFWLLTVVKHHAAMSPDLSYQRDPMVLLSNFLLVHLFSYQTNIVQAWTLFDEVQFYLLFSVLLLNRRIDWMVLVVWLSASLFFLFPADPYWSTVFSPNHILFGIGILVAVEVEKNRAIPAKASLWCGVAIFCLSIVVAGPFHRGTMIRLAGGFGAAGVLLGSMVLERRGALVVPRWLVALGDASYSIYIVHFMTISAVARFAYAHWGYMQIPIAAWMVFLFLFGAGMGVAVHFAVELPLLRVFGKQ